MCADVEPVEPSAARPASFWRAPALAVPAVVIAASLLYLFPKQSLFAMLAVAAVAWITGCLILVAAFYWALSGFRAVGPAGPGALCGVSILLLSCSAFGVLRHLEDNRVDRLKSDCEPAIAALFAHRHAHGEYPRTHADLSVSLPAEAAYDPRIGRERQTAPVFSITIWRRYDWFLSSGWRYTSTQRSWGQLGEH